MPTAIAAIEDAFGDALGPDLIAGLPAWSEARLIEARERYLGSARQLVPPLLAPGHLRPYVPIAASLVATPIRGHGHEVPLSRTAGLFLAHAAMGFTESEYLSPALTQLLLYCHSVALEDFVAAAMDPDPAVLGKGAWTARVAVALARLCELRSLVEKEIVVILPSPGARGESVEWPEVSVEAQTEILHELLEVPEGQQYPIFVGPGTDDLLRKVPAGRPPGGFPPYLVSRYEGLRDMYPNIEGISENADVWCWVLYAALVDSLTGWTWSASRSAEAQAVQVGLHPGGLDYYAPTYATRRALEMLAVADRPVASERMRQLLSLSVPGVEVVSTEDLVAIRADSPALETWRADLSTLLEEMRRFNEPDQARRDALARDWMQETSLRWKQNWSALR
jgi:hypothetical protein